MFIGCFSITYNVLVLGEEVGIGALNFLPALNPLAKGHKASFKH
jgi:hypothetical protein